MPTRLTVDVTQADIDRGVANWRACPIAWAVRRALPNAKGVRVDGEVYVDGASYALTRRARRFIKAFDEGHAAVAPTRFQFRLERAA